MQQSKSQAQSPALIMLGDACVHSTITLLDRICWKCQHEGRLCSAAHGINRAAGQCGGWHCGGQDGDGGGDGTGSARRGGQLCRALAGCRR